MSIESHLKIGDESSDEDKGRKNKKDQKPANNRWVQPPLPRVDSEAMFAESKRKDFNELFVRAPLPWEKPGERPAKRTEDGKEDDSETDNEAAADEKSENTLAGAEAVDAEPEAREPAEQLAAADESAEPEPDLQDVFETISQPEPESEPEQPPAVAYEGHMSIPHDEAAPDRPPAPSGPLTSEERRMFDWQVSREMPADFVDATSGEELGTPDKGPIPSWHEPTVPHPLGPRETSASAPEEPRPRSSEDSREFVSGYAPAPAPEKPRSAASSPERPRERSRPLTNRAVMTVAVAGYLAGRRSQRYNNEPLLRQQREALAEVHDEQRRTNERLAQLQTEAKQAAQPGAEQEIFDQDGNRIILQPGQRIERSTGGYSVVLDEHNRVVHDAIRYGEAFQREQQREQLSDDVFAAVGAGGATAGQGLGDDSILPAGQLPTVTQNQQMASQHHLIDQPKQVDVNHRLPESHKRFGNAVLNPWLWTAVAVLIIIYFLAALA